MAVKLILFVLLAATALLKFTVHAQSEVDCSVLNAINDVEIFEMGSMLFVVWQEPSNAIACGFTNIQHTLTYTGFESEQTLTTGTYYAYFNYYPHTCVPSIVNITAYTDTLSSEESSVEYYTETSTVESLNVGTATNGNLVATWAEPEDSELCDFVYLVTYSDNEQIFTIETTYLEADLDVVVRSCVSSTVTVTPINGRYSGIPALASYEGEIAAVRNYALTSSDGEVLAVFDPPSDIEECEISYEVREVQQECYSKAVEVAATNGRIYSPWMSDVIEVEISAVSSLVASASQGYIQVNWNEPEGASSCGVTYEISYGDNIYGSDGSSITLAGSLLACVPSIIQVTPISSSGKVGIPSSVQLQGELNAVQNLALESTGSGNVVGSWDAPQDSSSCALSYLLEFRNESGVHWYVTESTSYTLAYATCSVDVTLRVTPHGEDGSEGPDTTITLPATC